MELEVDIAGARSVLREAEVASRTAGFDICDLWWARALVHHWEGDHDSAARTFDHALVLAQDAGDRAREVRCLVFITQLELERGRLDQAEALSALLAERERREETSFPVVVQLLARRMRSHDAVSDEKLTLALYRLRSSSDARLAAFGLNTAATCYLQEQAIDAARIFAAMALAVASRARRRNEVAVAVATLVRAGEKSFAAEIEDLVESLNEPNALSARARHAVYEASAWLHRRGGIERSTVITAPSRDSSRPSERSPAGHSE
jgi:hypothetical protein